MTSRILVTEPIIDSVIQDLQAHYSVDVGKRGQFNTEQSLVEVIGEYDALLSMLSNPVTEKVIESGSHLKIVANHAVGYNNIDLQAAKKAGVCVANTPGVVTRSTADFTMALLLSVTRRLDAAQQFLRDEKFDGWDPLGFLGMELYGKTLGILGMGRIGLAVARRARAFGLQIQYHNRHRIETELEKELEATYAASLKTMVGQCDILSLHCPLTTETHHAINAEMLAAMPGHAVLINTARGPVVNEAALAEALHAKTIAGAGIDVFEEEPAIHPRLLTAPSCVLAPHIGSATHQTRKAIGQLAAQAIHGVLQEKPLSKISNLLPL